MVFMGQKLLEFYKEKINDSSLSEKERISLQERYDKLYMGYQSFLNQMNKNNKVGE